MPSFIYNNQIFEYTLSRKARKNINFHIKSDGEISISAPRYISKAELEKIVEQKAEWLVQSQKEVMNQKKNLINENIKTR